MLINNLYSLKKKLASSKLRHTVSILNDYDVPVFVNKTRNGSKRTLVKNKTKSTQDEK